MTFNVWLLNPFLKHSCPLSVVYFPSTWSRRDVLPRLCRTPQCVWLLLRLYLVSRHVNHCTNSIRRKDNHISGHYYRSDRFGRSTCIENVTVCAGHISFCIAIKSIAPDRPSTMSSSKGWGFSHASHPVRDGGKGVQEIAHQKCLLYVRARACGTLMTKRMLTLFRDLTMNRLWT